MSFHSALRAPFRTASTRPALTKFARPTTTLHNQRYQFSNTSIKMTDKSASGSVHMLESKEDYQQYIVEGKGPYLLDAFAEWCGPCKIVSPQIDKMSAQYDGAKFYKFDVDKLPDVAQELGIRAMPTFLVYNDGEIQKKIVGANVKAIEAAITALGVDQKAS